MQCKKISNFYIHLTYFFGTKVQRKDNLVFSIQLAKLERKR